MEPLEVDIVGGSEVTRFSSGKGQREVGLFLSCFYSSLLLPGKQLPLACAPGLHHRPRGDKTSDMD